jgi:SSS family solute:Na+ symporter
MPICYSLIEQDMGQRCFAAKTPKIIAPAAIFSGILIFLTSLLAIVFGILARQYEISIASGSDILLLSIQALTSPLVTHLFMATIVMAVISTSDSLLCSISAHLSSDFLAIDRLPEKKQLNISRWITFSIGISALVFIFLFNNIVTLLMFAYKLSVSILCVPIVMAVFRPKPSRAGALASIITGFTCFVLFSIWPISIPTEIIALGASILSFALGHFVEINILKPMLLPQTKDNG